jgi:hypothetical protein
MICKHTVTVPNTKEMRQVLRRAGQRLLSWGLQRALRRPQNEEVATVLDISTRPADSPFLLVMVNSRGRRVGLVGLGDTDCAVLPDGVGARVLRRCRVPRSVRPRDFGMPYALVVRSPAPPVFYGPDDDLSAVLRGDGV